MDKKQSSHKVRTFFKKNVYYVIMAVCLLAIAAMITVSVLINNGTIGGVNDDTPAITDPDDDLNNGTVPNPDDGNGNNNNNNNDDNTGTINPEPEQPTTIVLASPVNNANVLLNYSMDQLVWNSTLKHYAVHNGMDFGGNDGDEVFAAYDGEVVDVSYDILNGHSVTIKHSDTLSTVYKSLNEPVVSVGQKVTKGGVIGTMGTTATSEYSMGAHVHFMVLENGEIVDPVLHLAISEDK